MIQRRDVLRIGGLVAAGASGGFLSGLTRPAFAADNSPLPARIANTAGDTTLVLQELMHQQGYLEQMGLAPETINVADGSKLMGALFNGGADISVISGFTQVFAANERGGKLKILAGSEVLVELAVYSKRPDIKSLKDLEGKTVASGSVGALLYQLMMALFQKYNVDPTKITFVNIGGASDSFRAVSAGTVDAGPGPSSFYKEQAKYGVHALSDGNMWTEIPEYTYQGAYATDAAIASKRDVLVRTLAAYAKLYRFIQSPGSKEAYVKARLAVTKAGDAVQQRIVAVNEWEFCQKYRPFAVDLVLSEERINYMQRLNLQVGAQKHLLPFDQVADMSLARCVETARLTLPMPITDSQVHIWAPNTPERPWAPGIEPQMPEPLTAEKLAAAMDEAGVSRAVLVPSTLEGDRNDVVLAGAQSYPDRFAVMGRLLLDRIDAAEQLDTMLAQKHMLGLRLSFLREDAREMLREGRTDWFWPIAEARNIPVMLFAPGLLAEAGRIARAHPRLQIILDHMALSEKMGAEGIAKTVDTLLELAPLENVSVKVSALPCYSAEAYPFRDMHEPVRRVIQSFGRARCFWGTDYSRLSSRCTYRQAVTMFTEEMKFLSAEDLDWIMGRSIAEILNWPLR